MQKGGKDFKECARGKEEVVRMMLSRRVQIQKEGGEGENSLLFREHRPLTFYENGEERE